MPEGGIPRDEKARFYIQLVQNDKEKLVKIKELLNDLVIETGKIHNPSYSVDPDYWRMYVLANSAKEINMRKNAKMQTISMAVPLESGTPEKLHAELPLKKRMKI